MFLFLKSVAFMIKFALRAHSSFFLTITCIIEIQNNCFANFDFTMSFEFVVEMQTATQAAIAYSSLTTRF